jgi:hypothetical protein
MQMEELIARVTAAIGVEAATAEAAIGHVLAFLHKEFPEGPVADLLDKIPGARAAVDAAAAAPSEGMGGLLGGLGGLIGGAKGDIMGLAGKLSSLGLDMSQIQTLGREVFAHAKELLGEENVAKIVEAIPALKPFV